MYTHCDKDQSRYGYWYFHKTKHGGYKGGTYKGMDLTLGCAEDGTFCGVLIRSIADLENDTFIEGPCRSVNYILGSYKFVYVKEFTNNSLLNVLENKHDFVIRDDDTLEQLDIYSGSRVGLSERYEEYRAKKYRFAIKLYRFKKILDLAPADDVTDEHHPEVIDDVTDEIIDDVTDEHDLEVVDDVTDEHDLEIIDD
jgi:hypothetical protein